MVDFVFTVDTTLAGATPSNQMQLRFATLETYNATIFWGDGSSQALTDGFSLVTKTYAVGGVYQIRISGVFSAIQFAGSADCKKVVSVDQLGDVGWTTFLNAFRGCTNMTSFTVGDNADLSGVANYSACFRDCTSLDAGNMSGFVTSAATVLNTMFLGATSFDLDVSDWDISNVTGMSSMFLNVTLSTDNYSKLIKGWQGQAPSIQSGVIFSGGNSQYYTGGATEDARTDLINTYGWTITDGGGGEPEPSGGGLPNRCRTRTRSRSGFFFNLMRWIAHFFIKAKKFFKGEL